MKQEIADDALGLPNFTEVLYRLELTFPGTFGRFDKV